MAGKKRQREEMEAPTSTPAVEESDTLTRLRNMWEFANLAQFLSLFGKFLKIDGDLSIEALETECLIPTPSQRLLDIGFVLLKLISTQRGLNGSMFDEYMQKEYRKRIQRQQESWELRGKTDGIKVTNPFGDEDALARFNDLDIFTKIRVLQQLTQWALVRPELIRDRTNVADVDEAFWRVDVFGWDSDEREYFLLDDNRLYRREDPSYLMERTREVVEPKPKANSKNAKAAARASRRQSQRAAKDNATEEEDDGDESQIQNGESREDVAWELVALTFNEYNELLDTLRKSRDVNEKNLRARILQEVMPIVEHAEEEQKRKSLKRERELQVLEKLSNVKRSSRVAAKQEKEKEEQEALEAKHRKLAEAIEARKAIERQQKVELERTNRLMTREQRLQERGARRVQREQELVTLEQEGAKLENGNLEGQARISERNLKMREASLRQELEELQAEDWYFDCPGCGVHGKNKDDGKNIIACDKCNVWQHVDCLDLGEEVQKTDFEFICDFCKQMKLDQQKAAGKPPIMLKLGRLGSSQSPSSKAIADSENGDSMAHKTSVSSTQLPHDQSSKRPESSNGQKMPNSNRQSFGSHQVDPNGLPERYWEPQPVMRPNYPLDTGATIDRPPFATVQGFDRPREMIASTPQPLRFPYDIRPLFGQNTMLNEKHSLQPDSSSRQINHDFLDSPKTFAPPRPSPSPGKATNSSNDHLPSTAAAAVSTPGGTTRPYTSPYSSSSAGAARSSAHLSLPNDKDALTSPSIHLPPWSSPTANGTTPGTLPDASTGLSPTKNAKPSTSEEHGSLAHRDVQRGNLFWSRSNQQEGNSPNQDFWRNSGWPRALQQAEEPLRPTFSSSLGQQLPDPTLASKNILGKQQQQQDDDEQHERKRDHHSDEPNDQGHANQNGVQVSR